MYAAFIFIGVLFGVAMSITLALFYVLSLGGDFRGNLHAVAIELRDRLTGRRRSAPAAGEGQRVEADPRIRSLQEELRMANRLLDQTRNERETQAAEIARAGERAEQLAAEINERDARILTLETESSRQAPQLQTLREELATRSAELGRARREIKDLQVEIDVLGAGARLVSQ